MGTQWGCEQPFCNSMQTHLQKVTSSTLLLAFYVYYHETETESNYVPFNCCTYMHCEPTSFATYFPREKLFGKNEHRLLQCTEICVYLSADNLKSDNCCVEWSLCSCTCVKCAKHCWSRKGCRKFFDSCPRPRLQVTDSLTINGLVIVFFGTLGTWLDTSKLPAWLTLFVGTLHNTSATMWTLFFTDPSAMFVYTIYITRVMHHMRNAYHVYTKCAPNNHTERQGMRQLVRGLPNL